MPNLRPGSYSISPAVARGTIWEHTVEDWIDNAYIFNVVDTGLVYGFMKVPFDVRYRTFPTGREGEGPPELSGGDRTTGPNR